MEKKPLRGAASETNQSGAIETLAVIITRGPTFSEPDMRSGSVSTSAAIRNSDRRRAPVSHVDFQPQQQIV